jgi:carboxypeptidase D
MKSKVLVLLLLVCIATSLASLELADETEYVANVKINGQEDIATLTKRGISLENARIGSPVVEAYVSKDELKLLDELNFKYDASPNEAQRLARSKRNVQDGPVQYHNYDHLTAFMHDMATRYSNISRVFSLGKSVQGRELWAIQISDNPGVNEAEPEFKYIANMLGDETVGREICVYLIELILSNYQKDNSALSTRLTTLVNTVDIFIVPTMNPDGFERGTRGNARNKDLNRDFPDQFTSNHNDDVGRQPETSAIMNFVRTRHFVLSANFHGGSVVANYPWDGNRNYRSGQYSACPDDAVFKAIATKYADTHTLMRNAWEFRSTHGITNGADWYVLYGGMQDWNYLWNGVFEITIELSDDKYPPASQLAGFWDQNREAMIAYMELVNSMGVRGIATDASTGLPLDAVITVEGIDHIVRTDPAHGDYYRLLTAGSYRVKASATGYQSADVSVVIPEHQTAQVVHNFALHKL